jgi:quercetin dioxygenase-like cupin family protein
MDVKLDKGTVVARHTHPGIESTYVMEGSLEVPVEGRETKVYDAGQAFQIPPETPHAGGKPPTENVHIMINYIVEKGKPLIKFV